SNPVRGTMLDTYEQQSVFTLFAYHVFTDAVARSHLSPSDYQAYLQSKKNGGLDKDLADSVANALRNWAVENGATHYAHWFQPLTGLTAEKHESFLSLSEGKFIEHFSGEALTQQEPDASSLPHGGLRSTFEARGYTAWDPSSPAFILGNTLYLPSIFISYSGEPLDYKVPLLRSMAALQKAALPVLRLFDPTAQSIEVTVGPEQEFFLIPRAFVEKRMDLLLTGRTLIGAMSPKGQQFEDHYFGALPGKVKAFFEDLLRQAFQLGIPLRTRHNEVAPSQYECAPYYESANVAIDHNLLLMTLIRQTAKKHHLEALFHEKPFARINGSGKHLNWSLQNDRGENLLSPGKTEKEHIQFFVFVVCTLWGVHKYASLLRATIASAGNEHRLGGNEAPPPIISVFLGKALTQALEQLEKEGQPPTLKNKTSYPTHIPHIPQVWQDNTDRNRTSPLAFTGNKFEFRALGSSMHPADPIIVLNLALAEALDVFYQRLQSHLPSLPFEQAVLKTLRSLFQEAQAVCFEGNNYDPGWPELARQRGLPAIDDTPSALEAYLDSQNVALFEKWGILTRSELHARYEISLQKYIKTLQLEARVLGEMIHMNVFPRASRYLYELLRLEKKATKHFKDFETPTQKLAFHLQRTYSLTHKLKTERKQINALTDLPVKAQKYAQVLRPLMEEIRYHCDKVEIRMPAASLEGWPFPHYWEILFWI
ncbi:MAG: glutamine synthetase III family protein, partial [Bacteroidia bacterium]